MSRGFRIGSIIVIALLLAGTISITAFAQTYSNSGANGFAETYQNFISKLAANLGIGQDQLKSALNATKQQMLDEAVQQGRITQELADRLAEKEFWPGCGLGFGPKGFGGRGLGRHLWINGKNIDAVASILGTTPEQLKNEIDSGKNLEQIVTEHGMTLEQFNEKMLAYWKEQIKQDAASGKITPEMADRMLKRLDNCQEKPFFKRMLRDN